VVRMQNRIGAGHLFGSVPVALNGNRNNEEIIQTFTNAKSIQSHTDPVTQKFTMSLVPLEKKQNEAIVARIQDLLVKQKEQQDLLAMDNSGSNQSTNTNTAGNEEKVYHKVEAKNEEDKKIKLDKEKLRAAAGGGQYDEEEDPLNAPEILDAVAAFKKKLEDRDADLRNARQVIVDKKLEELVKKVKERKNNATIINPGLENKSDGNVAVVPPTGSGARETSKRGVSNLPAWMTAVENGQGQESATDAKSGKDGGDILPNNKRKLDVDPANEDSRSRKQKIELADGASMAAIRAANEAEDAASKEEKEEISKEVLFSSTVNWEAVDKIDISSTIKPWVTEKIVEYLGEEEVTLIDFVIHQISKHCSPHEMLDELTMVLDEDAEGFVVLLWKKLVSIE